MFGASLKATNSYFQKGMTFCRSRYVKKVMKLLAFIFEQPSYHEYILIFLAKNARRIINCQKATGLLTLWNTISGASHTHSHI